MRTLSFVAAAAMLALSTFVLSACATPTPYQPRDTSGYGFSESRIENNRYTLTFKGNTLTDREQVENALLYRAAELTLQGGYDYFVVTQRDTDSRSRIVSDGPSRSSFYFGHRYYSPRYGWRPYYDPFWNDAPNYRQITQYEATAEVAMYKGAKPVSEPRAFNAREVEANLRGKIIRPVTAAAN